MERDVRPPAQEQVTGQRNGASAAVVPDLAYGGGAERNAAIDAGGAGVQHYVGHPYRDETVGDGGHHRVASGGAEPVAEPELWAGIVLDYGKPAPVLLPQLKEPEL